MQAFKYSILLCLPGELAYEFTRACWNARRALMASLLVDRKVSMYNYQSAVLQMLKAS